MDDGLFDIEINSKLNEAIEKASMLHIPVPAVFELYFNGMQLGLSEEISIELIILSLNQIANENI